MDLAFVLPPARHLISGGNLYNQHLIAALDALLQEPPGRPASVRVLSAAEWAQEVDAGRAGVYLVDSLCLSALQACLPRRRPGQRFLLIVHYLPSLAPELDQDDPTLAPMLAVERQVLAQVDGFLTTSPFTRAVLIQRGLDAARIATVPPALPERDIPPLEYPGMFRGLMVGNLSPIKGVLALLEALAARLAPGERFSMEIAGRLDMDAEYAAACARLVDGSAVLRDAVRLRGAVPYEDMDACYHQASVFVSASRMETYGMALQEARRYGLPILAHAGGHAHSHFEHGENGYLYGSMADLADGCVALMRDPARAKALFEAAQRMRADRAGTWRDAAASLMRQLAGMPRARARSCRAATERR